MQFSYGNSETLCPPFYCKWQLWKFSSVPYGYTLVKRSPHPSPPGDMVVLRKLIEQICPMSWGFWQFLTTNIRYTVISYIIFVDKYCPYGVGLSLSMSIPPYVGGGVTLDGCINIACKKIWYQITVQQVKRFCKPLPWWITILSFSLGQNVKYISNDGG